MKNYLSLTLLCLVLTVPALAQPASGSLAGNWLGTLDIGGGAKLRFILKVEQVESGYTAKFDSVDQGARDLPIESITLNGNKVTFVAPKFGMSYEGTLNEKNDEITGTFKQGAGSTGFVFKRIAEIPDTKRPQQPSKPYPYNEVEVSYRNVGDNVKLTGTLTLPQGEGKFPAVLLISGSGSQDRDSTVFGHRPFLLLSDYLTRRGIAVLRVDDRGLGGSDLGSLSVTSENFMHDVLAGVSFLKHRKDIDPQRIGLIGHSEGGMIAVMSAARSKDIAFIVSLAGMGQTGDEVIQTQTALMQQAAGIDSDTVSNAVSLMKSLNGIVKTETDGKRIEAGIEAAIATQTAAMDEAQRKAFAHVASSIKDKMVMFKLPWYRYFVLYDPEPDLKKVKVPVLALNGELDLQVAWKENLDRIAAGLKAGGNKDVTVKAFPRLNHLFQTSQTGLPAEYVKIEETISPLVLETIGRWLTERTQTTTSHK
jgi:pimeloyl-ACP methyl ester carboxylesterase